MATQNEITTLNVSMPAAMRKFVEDEVTRGQYTSASEYLRELIRNAQQQQQVIDLVLPAGANGGPPPGVSKADWVEIRGTLRGLKIDELRRSLDRAEAQLERDGGKPLDIEAVITAGRARHAAKKRTKH